MPKKNTKTYVVSIAAMLVVLLGCSSKPDAPATVIASQIDHLDLADKIVMAHGGYDRWSALSTLSIDREHHMFRDAEPFHFQIVGDYATRRIYQHWINPTGQVVWDGERAWSNDWDFDNRFSARFTTAIGFYLANMPWYLLDSETKLLSVQTGVAAIPESEKEYTILEVEFEADPVRKPRGFKGVRDAFGIIVDPESFLITGIIERRSYGGQLEMSGAEANQTRFENIFVIDSHSEVSGLLWPHRYSLFTLSGHKYGEGRFYNYIANVAFDDEWMRPRVGDKPSRFDNSSSYIRAHNPTGASETSVGDAGQ